MTKTSVATRAERLHQRTTALLESLAGIPSTRATRTALCRAAHAACASNDVAALTKLHREVRLLADSLQHVSAPPATTSAVAPTMRRTSAGPGHPGWGQPCRSSLASWRRPHAPIQYPYGEPPTGGDRHRHAYAPPWRVRSPSAEQLASAQALERFWRLREEAEYELRQEGRAED